VAKTGLLLLGSKRQGSVHATGRNWWHSASEFCNIWRSRRGRPDDAWDASTPVKAAALHFVFKTTVKVLRCYEKTYGEEISGEGGRGGGGRGGGALLTGCRKLALQIANAIVEKRNLLGPPPPIAVACGSSIARALGSGVAKQLQ
jgi:hypothetical protein